MKLLANFNNSLMQSLKFKLKKVILNKNKKIVLTLVYIYKFGFILAFKLLSEKYTEILNRYILGKSVLRCLFLISKSSKKCYVRKKRLIDLISRIFFAQNGFCLIFSSKGGLRSDIECAMLGIGGMAALFFC